MKVLVIGDQHFRTELPYSSGFKDGRRGEWGKVLEFISEASKEAEEVVLMGDNLNTRHNSSTVIKEFVEFLNSFGEKKVHILVGNHERYGLSSALDFLSKIEHPHWTVYTDITHTEAFGRKVVFVPFLTPALVKAEGLEDGVKKSLSLIGKGDVAFLHQGITGAKVHGTWVDLFNEIVLPRENLEKNFERVITGHIHTAQVLSPKTLVTGSIFTAEVGEIGKSVWMLDSDTLEVSEIPLPLRGIYGVENPIEKVLKNIPKNSIVKCTVTDKKYPLESLEAVIPKFDSFILLEKYPRERQRLHFEEGGFDLTIDNLIKLFAESRDIDYNDLKAGMDIIRSQ
jgi:DNA repair exonuclease SbcCD nuclease subunit